MSSQTETWTILRLLQWTTDFFKSKKFESPRLDAEVLLAEALQIPRIQLYARYNDEPEEEARTAYRELVRRRAEGTPVAYLVGHKEFFSLSFRVDPAVLIPRPETEHVVLEAIDRLKALGNGEAGQAFADIGTGSGAIAIAIASQLPTGKGVAVDVSEEALGIARYNAQQHDVANRIEFVAGDLLQPLQGREPFDVIASNPPYVSQAEYDALPAEVRDHEPQGALLSGQTGLEVIERLIADALAHLKTGGSLLVELSPMLAPKAKTLMEATSLYRDVKLIKDFAKKERVLCGVKK